MAASDHVNPYQLKLFMKAHELMDIPSDDSGYSSLSRDEGLYDKKIEESHMNWNDYDDAHGLIFKPKPDESSLYDSISKRGVQTPVSVRLVQDSSENKYQPHLTNGNHRVAVAYDIDPEMYIGVNYVDSMYDDH